jgi:D-glycero-D-manno-heptose 1,7-bisphosphate phosphatase
MIYKEYAMRDFSLPLILLDRDGTLNKDTRGYTSSVPDLEMTDFAIKFSDFRSIFEFQISIVSNQSGIGRGYHSAEDYFVFTESLLNLIQEGLSHVQMIIACPHVPEMKCICRKPSSAMLDFAIGKSSLSKVCFVGDSHTDKKAAAFSGVEFFDVNSQPEVNLKSWLENLCDS